MQCFVFVETLIGGKFPGKCLCPNGYKGHVVTLFVCFLINWQIRYKFRTIGIKRSNIVLIICQEMLFIRNVTLSI